MTKKNQYSLLENGSAIEGGDESGICFVIFGGISEGIGVPPFEFRGMMQNLPGHKIYVRDISQKWYHSGIDEGARSLAGAVDQIGKMIKQTGARYKIFIGNSMGGFAAILFGQLLQADRIIAFAPQTYIDPLSRILTLDFRWRRQIKSMYSSYGYNKETYNLSNYLLKNPIHGIVTIYFGMDCRLDRLHAEKLRGVSNIEILKRQGSGHGLVKDLRATGELFEVLTDAAMAAQS